MSHSLSSMFRPESIAIVGASERSQWFLTILRNLDALGFKGKMHLVNRRGGVVSGRQTHASCAAIGEPVDVAVLMLPGAAVLESLADIGAAGIAHAIVLASGYSEAGIEGEALQQETVAAARALGIRLLGPNSIGFINYAAGIGCWAGSMRSPPVRGSIAVVSQSGAVSANINHFAHQQGVGLSCVIASGNEADIDVASVIDHLASDPDTHAIAIYAETLRNPLRFRQSAARAMRAGKPIVILKVGRSPAAVEMARSHTGSVVGDDKVFDAVCRKLALVRVDTIEELVFTAHLVSKVGELREGAVAVMSASGGMCGLAADYAELEALPLARFGDATQSGLRAILPSYASAANPLDLTGATVANPALFRDALEVVAKDAGVAAVACLVDVPTWLSGDSSALNIGALDSLRGYDAAGKPPVIVCSNTFKSVSAKSTEFLEGSGLVYLPVGARVALRIIRNAMQWSARMARAREALEHESVDQESRQHDSRLRRSDARSDLAATFPRTEKQALDHLERCGVPVIPNVLARDRQQAVDAASTFESQVVLKIASPDIAHKTEAGGVMLGLAGAEQVATAFDRIMKSARAHAPNASIDGVLVAPMRSEGIELFVGVRVDPEWGACIAVGLGGVWVELLKDIGLRLLPVDTADVMDMLSELRGAALLRGHRGALPVNLQRLASVIEGIGAAALGLGDRLETFEVNPLLAHGDRIEALDALATYRD